MPRKGQRPIIFSSEGNGQVAQKKSRGAHYACSGGGAPRAIEFAILPVRFAPEQNRKFNGTSPQSRCDWD
ncbi:hypothetical protein AXK11_04725 [Cephaloticoccus primus]|uniref:Uncharacterized protein n=1 Tax=Cephaloticoccus primus TaxID=1548207 RepID=A0A139SN39_9BACT|nr:hypothetical protein AXK11_04725 [Cephaloticoccus primus]